MTQFYRRAGSNVNIPLPPGDPPAGDPNPLPTWTTVIYAAPSAQGSGSGATPANAMAFSTAMSSLNGSGTAALTTVQLLPSSIYGNYDVTVSNPVTFNDSTDRGNGGWRGVGSYDPDDRAVIRETGSTYNQYVMGMGSGANRIVFYDLDLRNNSTGTITTSSPFVPKSAQSGIEGSSSGSHHIWVKGCRFWNFDSGGVTTASNHASTNTGTPRNPSDYILVEDCQFYQCGHLAPWGGSGFSFNTPTESSATADDIFTFDFDGSPKAWGCICRRNWFFGCYQRVTTAAHITDGNGFTSDYLTHDKANIYYRATFGDLPAYASFVDRPTYTRAVLCENNVFIGCGRGIANTYSDPDDGYYIRFNTLYYSGQTARYLLGHSAGPADEAAAIGGFNATNEFTYLQANIMVEDPTVITTAPPTSGPYGGPWNEHGKDLSSGYAPNLPTASFNTFQNNTYTKGQLFQNATNNRTGALGFSPPKTYWPPHNPGVDSLPSNPWSDIDAMILGMTTTASSAVHPTLSIAPSDGVDIAWNVHDGQTVGALSGSG